MAPIITRDSHVNKTCRPCVSSKILAHQNPPSPEARTTKPLREEDRGVKLKTPLRVTRAARTTDMINSGDLRKGELFFTSIQADTPLTAQRSPEKTFALSPGIITM